MTKTIKTKNFTAKAYVKKDVNKSYAEITALSGVVSFRVKGTPFLRLWIAIEKGDAEFVEAYGQLAHMTLLLIGDDSTFCNDLVAIINAWQERKDAEAKEAAAKVSDIDEESDNRLMRDAIEIAGGGKKVRKAKADELRQQIKDEEENG